MVRVTFGLGLALAIACGGRSVSQPEGSDAAGSGNEPRTGGSPGSNDGRPSASGGTGTGGSSIGTGGANIGTGGAPTDTGGGADTTPRCDPDVGELNTTPFPNCSSRSQGACDVCTQANCCEEWRFCYGYDPGNVCGWGGPTTGLFAGVNELNCFVLCARGYVAETGVFDDGGVDKCADACATEACGLIGNATQDLLVCLMDNCETDCFWP